MLKVFLVFLIAFTFGMACGNFCGQSEPQIDVSQYEVATPIYKSTSD